MYVQFEIKKKNVNDEKTIKYHKFHTDYSIFVEQVLGKQLGTYC